MPNWQHKTQMARFVYRCTMSYNIQFQPQLNSIHFISFTRRIFLSKFVCNIEHLGFCKVIFRSFGWCLCTLSLINCLYCRGCCWCWCRFELSNTRFSAIQSNWIAFQVYIWNKMLFNSSEHLRGVELFFCATFTMCHSCDAKEFTIEISAWVLNTFFEQVFLSVLEYILGISFFAQLWIRNRWICSVCVFYFTTHGSCLWVRKCDVKSIHRRGVIIE